MAVKTEVTNSGRTIAVYEELTKLSLTDELAYDERMVEPISGWGRGDYPDGEKQDSLVQDATDDAKEDMKFKEALIEELMKSNHDLRMRFAEAENKLAKMRAKMDSHCECCTRNKGTEAIERKSSYDWSSGPVRTFGRDSPYASPFAASQDNANPYVKVRRWQNAFQGEFSRAESSSSSTIPRSPKCLTPRTGNIRPESPATRDHSAGNFMLVPVGAADPPFGFREIGIGDSRPGSPKKIFRGNLQEIDYELDEECPSRHLPSVKSSPDERILSSRQQHLRSDIQQSPAFRTPRPPRNSENLDVYVDPVGHYAAMQRTKNYILAQHANVSQNATADDRGLVGRLMTTGNEHK